MKLPLRFTAFIISFILSILFMSITLIIATLFIGVCILFSPIILIYALYFITATTYDEMIRYIDKYSFHKYEIVNDKN